MLRQVTWSQKLQKVLSITLSTLLLVGVIALPSTAFARGNNEDTHFSFNFKINGTAATGGRKKTDASSTYIQVKNKSISSLYAYVDASTSTGWKNMTVGGKAPIFKTGQFRIRQDVFETYGRIDCRLGFWSPKEPGHIDGYWSPDSMRWYPALN